MIEVRNLADLSAIVHEAIRRGRKLRLVHVTQPTYNRLSYDAGVPDAEGELTFRLPIGAVRIVVNHSLLPGTMLIEWELPLRPEAPYDECDQTDHQRGDGPSDPP